MPQFLWIQVPYAGNVYLHHMLKSRPQVSEELSPVPKEEDSRGREEGEAEARQNGFKDDKQLNFQNRGTVTVQWTNYSNCSTII